MIFFGICIAVAIMIAVTYMAISKKSTFQVRVVSLICLAVMLLTVIICVVVAVNYTPHTTDWSAFIVEDPVKSSEKQEVRGGNNIILIVFIIFMLIFFLIIMFLAVREHKKHLPQTQ
jgi:amino acid transporter